MYITVYLNLVGFDENYSRVIHELHLLLLGHTNHLEQRALYDQGCSIYAMNIICCPKLLFFITIRKYYSILPAIHVLL